MPAKTKTHSKWACQKCGFIATKSYGKCPECGNWDSMVETIETRETMKKSSLASLAPRSEPQKIFQIPCTPAGVWNMTNAH